jgi:hypothetical protein
MSFAAPVTAQQAPVVLNFCIYVELGAMVQRPPSFTFFTIFGDSSNGARDAPLGCVADFSFHAEPRQPEAEPFPDVNDGLVGIASQRPKTERATRDVRRK